MINFVEQDGMIICHVTVDRSRTPQEAMEAIRRHKSLHERALNTMPRGEYDEMGITFFNLNHSGRGVYRLQTKYEQHGLKPCDPFSLAAVNEADPSFADEHPNITIWKGVDSHWYCAWFDESVFVWEFISNMYFRNGLWLAGVPK